ncbi:hypothetical protein [Neobacillus drentensis]
MFPIFVGLELIFVESQLVSVENLFEAVVTEEWAKFVTEILKQ